MLFEDESDIASSLSLLIDRDTNIDTINILESGLAQRIVEALHLDDDTSPFEIIANSYPLLYVDGKLS